MSVESGVSWRLILCPLVVVRHFTCEDENEKKNVHGGHACTRVGYVRLEEGFRI